MNPTSARAGEAMVCSAVRQERADSPAPDWQRERCRRLWDPSRRLLRSIRAYQWCRERRWASWLRYYWVLQHRFWSVVSGADIPLNCRIEGGLLIPHPNGIVIHSAVRIGVNCLILQQVTLGTGGDGVHVPLVGNHVDIGAGAKILGAVVLGDGARVGANAVVLQDVPPGATAVGIPARIVPRRNTRACDHESEGSVASPCG